MAKPTRQKHTCEAAGHLSIESIEACKAALNANNANHPDHPISTNYGVIAQAHTFYVAGC